MIQYFEGHFKGHTPERFRLRKKDKTKMAQKPVGFELMGALPVCCGYCLLYKKDENLDTLV